MFRVARHRFATMALPRIVQLIRDGAKLDDLQAAAGKLWLGYGGKEQDEGGIVASAIEAYWRGRPGADPYWDFLENRGNCDSCREGHKFENLSICPNCFKTYCYRHNQTCSCGHKPLGGSHHPPLPGFWIPSAIAASSAGQ